MVCVLLCADLLARHSFPKIHQYKRPVRGAHYCGRYVTLFRPLGKRHCQCLFFFFFLYFNNYAAVLMIDVSLSFCIFLQGSGFTYSLCCYGVRYVHGGAMATEVSAPEKACLLGLMVAHWTLSEPHLNTRSNGALILYFIAKPPNKWAHALEKPPLREVSARSENQKAGEPNELVKACSVA